MDPRMSAKFPFLRGSLEFAQGNSADLDSLFLSDSFLPARIRGRERVTDALGAGEVTYRPLMRDYDCLMEVMSYPYARMLVSVIGDRFLTKRYALGEAVRMNRLLQGESQRVVADISGELGFKASTDESGIMKMSFPDYLTLSGRLKSIDWKLINCDVRSGTVYISKDKFSRLMQNAFQDKIESELPLMPPDEYLPVLKKDAAPLEAALNEAKARMSPAGGEGMKDEYLPPCITHLLDMSMKGLNLPHSGRFALVTFMRSMGLDYDGIIRIFSQSPDFDESKSEYQIKHITGELNGNDPYNPPECKTMKTNGLCYEPDELCGRVNHPLNYYRLKSNHKKRDQERGS
ncbi:MAG: DNA primase large subunit PriL [Candidatus Methanomethylophilaceae archaeon]|nr:DNA primase large subunit PriL [Candidatus Methanomethylophilaceae archaeon]